MGRIFSRTVLAPLLGPTHRALTKVVSGPGQSLLVAFSGGCDSTALLLALREVAPRFGLRWIAAHADHGLDESSSRRAARACDLATALDTRLLTVRLDPKAIRNHPDGIEAGARLARYRWLTKCADQVGARFILTAHHADDQAETVLLRLKQGSAWMGLGGMARQRGRLIRPFLGLRHAQLVSAVASAGLTANDDPANRDLRFARTAIRQRLLPHLESSDSAVVARLGQLASRARAARRATHLRLADHLGLRQEAGVWSVRRDALAQLPDAVLPPALDLLAQRAGLGYPPGRGPRHELRRQLQCDSPVGCDVASGWRLEGDSRRIRLVPPRIHCAPFAYTLEVPGSVRVAHRDLMVRVREVAVADWMFRPATNRAGLGAALGRARHAEIRNRRPGDRLRPLGCTGHRRLKDLLIDRRVPRHERDRLPLIMADDRIAWVPGVVLDHHFRIRAGDQRVWQVELVGSDGSTETNRSDETLPRNL
jgi:tRNA(Ile)-lysidine synthase